MATTKHVELKGPASERAAGVLTPQALEFLAGLQREFGGRRLELLRTRDERQARYEAGEAPDFLSETKPVREADWKVASIPSDLRDRRVEITGPTDAKMLINALNSGARVFMADFEDANSPTWSNLVEGQANLTDAIERRLRFTSPDGKEYRLNDKVATLLVRPRGWHLDERHVEVDGKPMSGSLFDFGLYFFHNAERLLGKGSGPYFYLPKLESHIEARLWNDVFNHAQDALKIPRGTIRATVLIETILAAFEMEEILYELRDWGCALNAGRWDYIFSAIKKFRTRDWVLPDRVQVTMTVPFMRAYTELLVRSCHRRGAYAIGGMAAFIPSRKDAEANEIALSKVREDKERESGDGFDGSWVAHPDLVLVCTEVFDGALGERPNQVERLREEVVPSEAALLSTPDTPGEITDAGVRTNVSVGVRYLESWLHGVGAAAIDNLMEDAATAEISRSQIWQWVRRGRVDEKLVRREIELVDAGDEAKKLFAAVALSEELEDFLTLPAYERLD